MSTHTHDPRPVVETALEGADAPACDDCGAVFADAEAARDALLPPGEPSEAVWARIDARIQALSRVRVVLSCTYCKDSLGRPETVYCAACLAPHHAECFAEHGRCSTPGCEERDVVRAHTGERAGRPTASRRPPRWHWRLAATLAGLGVVAALTTSDWAEGGGEHAHDAPVAATAPEPDRFTTVASYPRYVTGTATRANVTAIDADLSVLIQQLAELGGANVIISPEVNGAVTTQLRDVQWLSALHAIVVSAGDFAVVQERDDLLRITPAWRIEQQVETRVFDVSHFSHSDVRAMLPAVGLLAGDGKLNGAMVTHVPEQGSLIVTSGVRYLEEVETLLRQVADGGGEDALRALQTEAEDAPSPAETPASDDRR